MQNVVESIKNRINNTIRKIIIQKHTIRYKGEEIITKIGNNYGGYSLFSKYLLDNEENVILSFGIGEDLSFSEEILKNYSAKIYAFDPTPKTKEYVSNHPLANNSKFAFFPIGISQLDSKQTFYFPKNKNYVSCSTHKHDAVGNDSCEVEMCCFSTIINMLHLNRIDVLKMDIEGSEFDVMDQVLNTKMEIPIKQIAIEIHDYLFSDGSGTNKLKWILDLFKHHGYKLGYVDTNGKEMTFIKLPDGTDSNVRDVKE